MDSANYSLNSKGELKNENSGVILKEFGVTMIADVALYVNGEPTILFQDRDIYLDGDNGKLTFNIHLEGEIAKEFNRLLAQKGEQNGKG